MKKIKDYHDLYLKCDAILLGDVFQKFRNRSLESLGLCHGHYLSALAINWDTILSMTRVELDLLSDVGINMFFEKGMRSDIFYIFKRYIKANKKHLTSYDPKKRKKYITFLDKNNF